MFKTFRHTLHILTRGEKDRLIFFAFTDVIISILDIATLAALLVLINFYTQPGTMAGEWFAANKVIPTLLILAGIFVIKNLGAYFINKSKYKFVYRVASRLSAQNLQQYLEGSYHDYVNKDSAVHIRRISQQPVEFAHYVLSGFQQLISESIMVLLTIIAILWYNTILFILLFVALAPPLIVLSFYIKKRIRTVRGNIKATSESSLQHLKEALAGYIESNIYHAKDFFTRRYHGHQQALNSYLASLQSAQALPARLMEIFAVIGLLLLIAFNEFAQADTIVPVVTIGAFVAAGYKIIPGLVKILNISGQVKTYAFTAEDMLNDQPQSAHASAEETIPPIRSISMKNVSFSYGEKQILYNINFDATQGELVGIQGISGKGKTTLINLLLGFLDPTQGEICINGISTTAAQRRSHWKNISYVKQQPFLVHDNILTNIVLTDEETDRRVMDAYFSSGLSESLKGQPENLNMLITENGRNISGGQRQRVAFARAIYKNAGVMILDEPFNELDEPSEHAIMQELRNYIHDPKLILLITHNTKTLALCTRVISLDAN